MNKPVSFELAKLLKEKGFEVKVRPMYYFEKSIQSGSYMYNTESVLELCAMPLVGLKSGWIDAPTIADVVMWLYEKHNIWIMVNNWKEHVLDDDDNILEKIHLFAWFITGEAEERTFNSPIEAYEAGIKYCLEKVI